MQAIVGGHGGRKKKRKILGFQVAQMPITGHLSVLSRKKPSIFHLPITLNIVEKGDV